MTTEPALRLMDVHKHFGPTPIIRGVSLDIAQGERHAIIGPNGAGKSTLFNLISGRLPVTSGRIQLNGEDITGRAPFEINRRGLSRSFQVTNIFPRMSVYENVRCGVLWSLGYRYSFWRAVDRLRDAARRTEQILEQIHLTARRDVPAGVLTYAEQRALEIGITIAGGADVILLDEPTAGMSSSETAYAVELIRALSSGKTLVDGGARHERRLRPRRPHLGAGLRRGHRHRHAGPDPREPRGAGSLPRHGDALMLAVRDLHAYYGKSHILQGVSFDVGQGEIVSLLGRNGAGRSTTIKAIMGDVPLDRLDPLPGRGGRPASGRTRSRARDSATSPRTATSSPASPCART